MRTGKTSSLSESSGLDEQKLAEKDALESGRGRTRKRETGNSPDEPGGHAAANSTSALREISSSALAEDNDAVVK
jgi:hypothetical protein